jgi:hypothetical protein
MVKLTPLGRREEGETRVSLNLVRWGGLAGVVAGVLYALIGIIGPQSPVFPSFSDYLIEVFAVALLFTLVAIAGLHVLQRDRYGRLGAAGSLTAFIGYALVLLAATATALAGREILGVVFSLGVLGALVGLVLLGTASLRARMLPPWCGVLLIAGFLLSIVLDILVFANAGDILRGVIWALVGYVLWSQTGAATEQPSRVN